jgi:hypothetical protein
MLVGVTQWAVVVFLRVKRNLRVRILRSSLCPRLVRVTLGGMLALDWRCFDVIPCVVKHDAALPRGDAHNQPRW